MFKLKTTLGTNNICGANLIRLRHERGISQRQLAKNMQIAGYDVDHHFIRRIENGERFVTSIVAFFQDRRLSVQRNVTFLPLVLYSFFEVRDFFFW